MNNSFKKEYNIDIEIPKHPIAIKRCGVDIPGKHGILLIAHLPFIGRRSNESAFFKALFACLIGTHHILSLAFFFDVLRLLGKLSKE